MSDLTFTGDVVVYLLTLAATLGTVMWRIGALEKKVDKHNNMIERMYKVEDRLKSHDAPIRELEELHPRKDD